MEETKKSILFGILSITGKPGLYRNISQGGNKLIVESLLDGKRLIVSSNNQVISLADIAIYGDDEEKPLEDIFRTIYKVENKGKASVNQKSSNSELNEYFGDIYPEFDTDRVYVSDIKKVIKWYDMLIDNNILNFDENSATEEIKDEE